MKRLGQPDLTPTPLVPDLPMGIHCETCEESCSSSTDAEFLRDHRSKECRLVVERPRDRERKPSHCKLCGREGFTARTHPNHDESRLNRHRKKQP